jgi:hypothetical protein
VCAQRLALWLDIKLSRVLQGIPLEGHEAWFRSDHKSSRTRPTRRFKGTSSFDILSRFPCDLIAGIELGCDVLRECISSGTADCIVCHLALKRNTDRSGSKTWTSDMESTTASRQIPAINLR